ncbi:MAG: imidazole glycerol phosphate synthase subunit HisF [Thermoproteota archaeon]
MLSKRIIPCLDVKDGRVVKGVHFRNLKDAGDPVELAKRYEEDGADEIVFLDITASLEGRAPLLDVIERTAEDVFIPLTIGGGIRTLKDIRTLLNSGADKVSINTNAVEEPDFIKMASERFGSQCIVVAVDAKRNSSGRWNVFTISGSYATGLDVEDWCKRVQDLGAGEILLTSMDSDGTRAGYDLELMRKVSESIRVPLIASGGAGNVEHIYDVLTKGKADAALAASIFHYGLYSVSELKKQLSSRGLVMRL